MESQQKRLARQRLWRGQPCPHCGIGMWWPNGAIKVRTDMAEATLDHIVPRRSGGGHAVQNLRIVCRLCNASRAITGDCVGALACVRAVIGRQNLRRVARAWARWTAPPSTHHPRRRKRKKRAPAAPLVQPATGDVAMDLPEIYTTTRTGRVVDPKDTLALGVSGLDANLPTLVREFIMEGVS